jgi:hypothetical protein
MRRNEFRVSSFELLQPPPPPPLAAMQPLLMLLITVLCSRALTAPGK